MAISADTIWLDGKLVPFSEANVHVTTHTLHYGLGAFEGIRCYERADGRAAIFRLKEHVRRLIESSHICMMEVPYTQQELEQACVDTVRSNGFGDCYLRPVVFLGGGELGLAAKSNKVQVSVIAWQWGAYLGDDGLKNGIRAKVSSYARNHVNSVMAKGKINGQYVNSLLAKREVMKAGYDEAIMLDTEGYVSEASGENMFMVRDGELWTTPIGGSILGGITRDTIIRLAAELGIPVRELRFTRDMLYVADEVFGVGTAAEVTPFREIDDRRVGTGSVGPITQQLQAAYFDLVRGSSTAHPEWLTYID